MKRVLPYSTTKTPSVAAQGVFYSQFWQWQATPAITATKNEASISMIAHPLSVASIGAVTYVFYHKKEGLSVSVERKVEKRLY